VFDVQSLISGVPHDPVLSQLVFTVYTCIVETIAQRSGFIYHLHADDRLLYASLDPENELRFSLSFKNVEHSVGFVSASDVMIKHLSSISLHH